MALGKQIATGKGVAASYWRIGVVHVDCTNASAWTQVDGYYDEAARQGGSEPLESKTIPLPYQAMVDQGRAQIYQLLAGGGEFVGAEEV